MKFVSIAMSAAAIASGIVLAAPQASNAGSTLCSASRVCIYDHANWVGLLGQRAAGGGQVNVSSSANNLTSSWENKTGTNARWYQNWVGYDGFCRNMLAQREDNYVGDSDNDRLSSWATNGAC